MAHCIDLKSGFKLSDEIHSFRGSPSEQQLIENLKKQGFSYCHGFQNTTCFVVKQPLIENGFESTFVPSSLDLHKSVNALNLPHTPTNRFNDTPGAN